MVLATCSTRNGEVETSDVCSSLQNFSGNREEKHIDYVNGKRHVKRAVLRMRVVGGQ